MIAERRPIQMRTTYIVRDDSGRYLEALTFRDIMCLVAAEQGRVRARWHRTHAPYFGDAYLLPECDDHGVGYGTITRLQSRWGRPPLIHPCKREGRLKLTAEGRRVLAEIRRLTAPPEGEKRR